MTEDSRRVYRIRLKRQDFLDHGFTESCLGCQAIIFGAPTRGHTEGCRERMEKVFDETEDGRRRRSRQEQTENEALARNLKKNDEHVATKRKRDAEEVGSDQRGEGGKSEAKCSREGQGQGEKRKHDGGWEESDMEISMVNGLMREDMKWGGLASCATCACRTGSC